MFPVLNELFDLVFNTGLFGLVLFLLIDYLQYFNKRIIFGVNIIFKIK